MKQQVPNEMKGMLVPAGTRTRCRASRRVRPHVRRHGLAVRYGEFKDSVGRDFDSEDVPSEDDFFQAKTFLHKPKMRPTDFIVQSMCIDISNLGPEIQLGLSASLDVFLDFSNLKPEIQSSHRGGFGSQNGCKTP